MKYIIINSTLLLLLAVVYVRTDKNSTVINTSEISGRKSRLLKEFNTQNLARQNINDNYLPVTTTHEISESSDNVFNSNQNLPGIFGRRRQPFRNRNRRNGPPRRQKRRRIRKLKINTLRQRRHKLRNKRKRRNRVNRINKINRPNQRQKKRRNYDPDFIYVGRQNDENDYQTRQFNDFRVRRRKRRKNSNGFPREFRRDPFRNIRKQFGGKKRKSGNRKFEDMIERRQQKVRRMLKNDMKRADKVHRRRNRLRIQRKNRAQKQANSSRRIAQRRQRQ